ncbi:hypothetical protein ACGFIW_30185 [Micromonospora sp. NPDC048935]|uniref:hypothetical protein n=1 Tax=Micromonospora sp. NPDC048935 TaxID=3364262 RepID=UPI003721BCA0
MPSTHARPGETILGPWFRAAEDAGPSHLASMRRTSMRSSREERTPREFVYCSGWDRTPFADLRARLSTEPGWQVHDLPTGHDAMREAPDAVAALLLGA